MAKCNLLAIFLFQVRFQCVQIFCRCCNDIVLELISNKITENETNDSEYKDLKRLEVCRH